MVGLEFRKEREIAQRSPAEVVKGPHLRPALCSWHGTLLPCSGAETQTPGVHSVPHFPLHTLPGRMGTSSKGLKGLSSSVLILQPLLWAAELLSTCSLPLFAPAILFC